MQWFEKLFKSTIGQGYWISFIVGDPGAGKSHFMCHLDYLFNAIGHFNGFYSTFSAGQSKITSRDLWIDFFLNNDVIKKIKQLLPKETIESHNFRSTDVKENIIAYTEGALKIDNMKDDAIQAMAAGVSSLLATRGAGMCMIIDNVDEYFRYLSSLREPLENLPEEEKKFKEKQQELDDLQIFFGTLRTTCRDMPNFLLLVACTTPLYTTIEGHAATVDRTLAGRIQYQPDYLKTLTKSQAFELVHKYLELWSKMNDVNLPMVEECTLKNLRGDLISIYPFSRSSIEEIYEVTGQFARDIKMICNECINNMKFDQKTWIVKDEYLAYAIDEAHKKRPQIVPKEKLERFNERRTIWLKGKMKLILEKVEAISRHKHALGIDEEALIGVFDTYATDLGIATETASTIQNKDNFQWIDPRFLRIWKYKGEKRILVSHVFSNDRPLGKTYFKYIEWKDISNAISYIRAGVATHVLFVTRWCGGFSEATRQYWFETARYKPVIETLSLDDAIFKIIGAVEDGGSDMKDLIEHVDTWHFKLREKLDGLVARSIPAYEPPEKEKRLIDRG